MILALLPAPHEMTGAGRSAKARSSIYHRLFALITSKTDSKYEREVSAHKRRLFGGLSGTVAELGPGPGTNLCYFPAGVRWIGIEPNIYMHRYLRRRAARLGRTVRLFTAVAEELPLATGSVDSVVTTGVLCSLSDVDLSLREVVRVLRPLGSFRFVEHVAAPPLTRRRVLQALAAPVWSAVADGCCLTRDLLDHIEQAGFANVQADKVEISQCPSILRTHIVGIARAF